MAAMVSVSPPREIAAFTASVKLSRLARKQASAVGTATCDQRFSHSDSHRRIVGV